MQYNEPGEVGHRLALEVLPLDTLVDFARAYPDDVPWFLAYRGQMVVAKRNAPLVISDLMKALLQNFGDRDDVLRNLDANFHSFMTVGPMADYYDERLELVEDIPAFGNPKIAAWKEDLRCGLSRERDRAKATDDEFESGIF